MPDRADTSDFAIIDGIVRELTNSGEFDEVRVLDDPAWLEQASSQILRAATVALRSFDDASATDADDVTDERTIQVAILIGVRTGDQESRAREASRLGNAVSNAINGNTFGLRHVTARKTRVRRGRFVHSPASTVLMLEAMCSYFAPESGRSQDYDEDE